MLDERLLQRMQRRRSSPSPSIVVIGAPVILHRERQARQDALAVDQHRAGAARALVAALLGAREPRPLAQQVEQALARLQLDRILLAVDTQIPHRQSTRAYS